MHHFWKGTVSSLCLFIAATSVGGTPPMGGSSGGVVVTPPPTDIAALPLPTSQSPLDSVASSSSLASMASPSHHSVVAGSASVSMASPDKLVVTQTSDRAIMNWDQFNIKPNETVEFKQPGPDSVTLNRVTGNHGPSQIMGNLSANGHVFLLNPSGVIIGKHAHVDASGFVASTDAMTNDDFMQGHYTLTPLHNGGNIEHHGHIKVLSGGLALISSGRITQDGYIQARMTCHHHNGHPTARLAFDGDDMITVDVPIDHVPTTQGIVLLKPVEAQKLLQKCTNTDHAPPASQAEVKGGMVVISGKIEVAPGDITIHGQDVSLKQVTLTSSRGDKGGKIRVTGTHTKLTQTTLDTEGPQGEGRIVLGGEKGDKTPQSIHVDTTSTLKANATKHGDGGTIMVWSDDKTSFHGKTEAMGGPEGGNGGQAEVSGKIDLSITDMKADLSAPHGQQGTLTLDPKNITVGDAGGIYDQNNLFENNRGAPLTLTADELAAVPGDVILQGNTDDTFEGPNEVELVFSLTAQAGRSVIVSTPLTAAGITIASNYGAAGDFPGNGHADPDNRDIDPGNVLISANLTSTGTLSLTATDYTVDPFENGEIIVDAPVIITSAGAQTLTGPVSLLSSSNFRSTAGGVTFQNEITGAGDLSSTAEVDLQLLGPISTTGTVDLTSTTGNITVAEAVDGPVDFSARANAGEVNFGNSLTVTNNITARAHGTLTFTGPVSGGGVFSATSDTENVFIEDGVTGFTSLVVNALLAGVTLDGNRTSITTSGNQTYTWDPVGFFTVNNDKTIESTGGSLTFTGNLSGVNSVLGLSANGNLVFSEDAAINNFYGLGITCNGTITVPNSIDIGTFLGTDTVLYFGGSAGGRFENVVLNGIDGVGAAAFAALYPNTTGLYYVNGVLIGASSTSTTTLSSDGTALSVRLPQFEKDSTGEKLDLYNPLGQSDLIIMKRNTR